MDCLATKVKGIEPLTIIAKLSILDAYNGPGYTSGCQSLFPALEAVT